MQVPLDIDFHDMTPSEAVAARVRERVAKLEDHFSGIVGCRVGIEAPHHHHQRGNLYHVKVVVQLPGREVVVNRGPGNDPAHKDVYVAIRDAFDASERQLATRVDRMRGEVKAHVKASTAG